MGQHEREIANHLLKESIKDHALNYKILRGKIKTEAHHLASQDRHNYHHAGETLSSYEKELNLAVREVLGIIPSDKWDHSDRTLLNKVMGEPEKMPDHGLVCATSPKTYNPDKSLEEQGYTFIEKQALVAKDMAHHHDDSVTPHSGIVNSVSKRDSVAKR